MSTTNPTDITPTDIAIDELTLLHGMHIRREDGMCAMEAVAWMAREPHSDAPACTCPVIAAFVRRLNDAGWSSDITRTEALRPYLPRLIGTRSTEREVEIRRGLHAADWAVRFCVPIALDRAGLFDYAVTLRGLSPITDATTAYAADAAASTAAADAAKAADAASAASATKAASAAKAASTASAAYSAADASSAAAYAAYAAKAYAAAADAAAKAARAAVAAADAAADADAARAARAAAGDETLRSALVCLDRMLAIQ